MIAMPAEELWETIRDPHHLPRWWPRVMRVEDVEDDAFTEVMKTRKGKLVRADFNVVACDDAEHSLIWAQRVEGTPFARLLKSAETEVRLRAGARSGQDGPAAAHAGGATEVTIELRQALNGLAPRFGGYMVRRAARATIDEALDGLERIGG
jgi:carbon monoxide dehydrogenase subunit G